jgi:hypothetical protein
MRTAVPILIALFGSLTAAARQASDGDGIEFFERKIRPVLVARCHACHSAGAESVKGGLLLDSREAMLQGGASGPAIVPGRPDRSLLLRAVRYADEDLRMPPKVKDRLAPAEVADFETWVRRGAPAPPGRPAPPAPAKPAKPHWAFLPLADPAPPVPRLFRGDVGNEIDGFILAKLEERGLRPAAAADPRTLLRRATFDLTGLPPAPEEVEAFLADRSPDAFAKVVDRLLASPHYGERWGRHWLDLVRYADTAGDNSDFPVPQAYRYRNYVIRAFNEDKPYDQFLREQIAGDLLPAATDEERRDRLVATGFIAMARRFGTLVLDYNPHQIIEDTIDTLGRSVLGLSLGCARCHDHKFDPLSQADYYALYGIFESTRYPFPGLEEVPIPRDFVPLVPKEEADAILRPFREKLGPLEAEVARLEKERAAFLERAAAGAVRADEAARLVRRLDSAIGQAKRKRDDAARDAPPLETAYAVVDAERTGNARLHVRGDPRNLGAEVPRRFLSVLGGASLPPEARGSGRLELAAWLTDPRNPLTARVIVNRIWQHHFGRGLVSTPSDFGVRGAPPTHPDLLDFLARRFQEGGGSIKALHRRILLSRAYQRSSAGDSRNAESDPDNEFLWRFPRRRLEAEAIRDALLAVSGTLDRSPGGPHPFPPPKTWRFTQHNPFTATYETRRRSVYLMTQRFKKDPFFATFDGADPNASTPVRTSSVTPAQALALMNDPFVRGQARAFAARLLAARDDDAGRVELAYLLAFGRPPADEERRAAGAFLREAYARHRDSARGAWSDYAQALFSVNEFLFVD